MYPAYRVLAHRCEWGISPISHQSQDFDTQKALNAARDIVAEAGQVALSEFGTVQASYKADGSMVTRTDRLVESMIREALRENYPGHAILGEEEGLEGADGASEVWIVDPIDGTNNFFYGLPMWGVSLGLFRDDRPCLGALYMPCSDQMFSAGVGLGVFANGESVAAHDGAEINENELLTISSPPLGRWDLDLYMKPRIFGCASFAMASVPAGICRALIHTSYYIWDAAAALCMMKEAGVVATDPDGNSLYNLGEWNPSEKGPPMIAAAPQTHEIIMDNLTFNSG